MALSTEQIDLLESVVDGQATATTEWPSVLHAVVQSQNGLPEQLEIIGTDSTDPQDRENRLFDLFERAQAHVGELAVLYARAPIDRHHIAATVIHPEVPIRIGRISSVRNVYYATLNEAPRRGDINRSVQVTFPTRPVAGGSIIRHFAVSKVFDPLRLENSSAEIDFGTRGVSALLTSLREDFHPDQRGILFDAIVRIAQLAAAHDAPQLFVPAFKPEAELVTEELNTEFRYFQQSVDATQLALRSIRPTIEDYADKVYDARLQRQTEKSERAQVEVPLPTWTHHSMVRQLLTASLNGLSEEKLKLDVQLEEIKTLQKLVQQIVEPPKSL